MLFQSAQLSNQSETFIKEVVQVKPFFLHKISKSINDEIVRIKEITIIQCIVHENFKKKTYVSIINLIRKKAKKCTVPCQNFEMGNQASENQ